MATRNGVLSRDYLVPALVGAGFVLVVGGTGVALAASSPNAPAQTAMTKTIARADAQKLSYTGPIATSSFPVNAKGLTYGSDAAATGLAQPPDLVVVVGDHGIRGFVLAKALYADANFASPEEALAYQKKLDAGQLSSLPVYDVTDSVVVDTFTAAPGVVSYAPNE